jgi:ketosteroid isomerase-like protein
MENSDNLQFVDYIHAINNAWRQGKTNELYNYFSNDVVFASPKSERYLRGKELCIRSYQEFTKKAKIHQFTTTAFITDRFEDVAVITYKYSISYEMDQKEFHESGYEIMVFKKFGEDWLVIWRTQMSQ